MQKIIFTTFARILYTTFFKIATPNSTFFAQFHNYLIAKVNSGIQIINMELTSTKEKLEFNYSNDYNNKIDDAYYKRKECLLL